MPDAMFPFGYTSQLSCTKTQNAHDMDTDDYGDDDGDDAIADADAGDDDNDTDDGWRW